MKISTLMIAGALLALLSGCAVPYNGYYGGPNYAYGYPYPYGGYGYSNIWIGGYGGDGGRYWHGYGGHGYYAGHGYNGHGFNGHGGFSGHGGFTPPAGASASHGGFGGHDGGFGGGAHH